MGWTMKLGEADLDTLRLGALLHDIGKIGVLDEVLPHVADAYDAMTSARAYRSGRLPHEAIADLHRCVGTDFDRASVEALVASLPRLPAASAGFDPAAFQCAATTRTHAS
jgi:HD-GYP domain-containing protein (c-di-GMP phosphodiesterase class II)